MKKKIFLITILTIIIMLICPYLVSKNMQEESKDSSNITKYSEEFMNNYFGEIQEIQNDKDNVLIVTSENKIEDGYGASKIIEAPNNQYFLQYTSKEERNNALKNFKKNKEVVSAEENIVYTIMENQSFNSWGIEKIGLDEAKQEVNDNGGNEVTVAIIDTGCDMELFNKSYQAKIVETYNVLNPGKDMTDEHGHGTKISGVIAEGTPDNVKILPVKVSSDGTLYNTDIIAAINYISYYKKADVINMSFVSYTKSDSMLQAINAANEANIICIAAAGNDNTSQYAYPAAYDSTISIAACDSTLKKASFSNYGSTITFTAPGVGIKSIKGTSNGTSIATPHAVCAAAILKSYNKNYTIENIIDILKIHAVDLGDRGRDDYYGHGLINMKGITYCYCNCDKCDNIYCQECKCEKCLFNNKTSDIKKIEVDFPTLNTYNYGSITNLYHMEIKIYQNDETYYTKYFGELDDCEIIGYDPYCYTSQIITVNYKGHETSFALKERDIYECGWEYEQIDEKNIRLIKYKEEIIEDGKLLKKVHVPQTIDGYIVTSLGTELFRGTVLENVILPPTVTEICASVFYESQLKKIDIQAEKIKIGDNAFYGLESLETVNSSISSLGESVFYGCIMLENIILDDSLKSIGANAFLGCSNLENLTIPQNVTSIGEYAFFDTNIKNITIPNGVTKIERNTFKDCVNLEYIIFPQGLIEIKEQAFSGCTNLKSIYIPKNVTQIEKFAFIGCGALETITVDKENEKYDSRNNCNALVETETNTLLVSSHSTVIPSTIKIISQYAFSFNIALKQVDIPEGVEEIQDYAFYGSQYLKKINMPKSVKIISDNAFEYCAKLALWVYKDSYAKTYAKKIGIEYFDRDPSEIKVYGIKEEYKVLESVNMQEVYIELYYDDGRVEEIREGINIKYTDENTYFVFGDTYFTISTYNENGEYIEKLVPVRVIVSEIKPESIVPSRFFTIISR